MADSTVETRIRLPAGAHRQAPTNPPGERLRSCRGKQSRVARMARQIFRQEALNRLASPELLDRPVRMVGSAAWLGLVALVCALFAGLAWAAVSKAPIKVTGQGIIVSEGGLVEITAFDQGRIQELYLRPGQAVAAGETVALIGQSDLTRQLENARASLTDARTRLDEITAFYTDSGARKRQADDDRLATIAETEALLKEQLKLLVERAQGIRGLVERKAMVRERLIDAEVDVNNTRERLANLDDERLLIALNRLDFESKRTIELLDQRLKVEEFEREVGRLTRLLADRELLVSPYDGRVVEVKVNPGDVIQPGSALATLATTHAEAADEVYGLLYVPPHDGKQVAAGMAVEIALTTVRREEFGYVIGRVVEVAPLPATFEGMRRTLQNDRLVEQLSGSGAPFEARVLLERDPATPSGFKWSSSRGADIDINAGTLFEGQVIVRHKRLASFLAPGLEQVFGDDAR